MEANPIGPFHAVQDKFRRVDVFRRPGACIAPLPLGVLFAGQLVAPAEIVPIVHVKSHRHKFAPQARRRFQPAQPRLGRRATAAPFRRVKFQQRRLSLGALKRHRRAVGPDAGKHRKEANPFHRIEGERHYGAILFRKTFSQKKWNKTAFGCSYPCVQLGPESFNAPVAVDGHLRYGADTQIERSVL